MMICLECVTLHCDTPVNITHYIHVICDNTRENVYEGVPAVTGAIMELYENQIYCFGCLGESFGTALYQ